MNCAKVKIGAGSGSSTPSQPSQPSQSSTAPEQPYQSSAEPQQPEEPSTPATTSLAEYDPPSATVVTTTTVVATTVTGSEPTETASDDSDSSDDSSSEDSDSDSEDSDSDNDWSWKNGKPHRAVKQGARRYKVDGSKCECRRDELTLAARCSCDASEEKRNAVERKALRMHRRTFYKRVDACSWDSAPAMEVSYYTEDAKCAPNAKLNMPESDDFELKWDVSCGAIEGGSEYPLHTMTCNMYGA